MSRFAAVTERLGEYGVDAVMATSEHNRLYVTGFRSSAGVAVASAGGSSFFTDSRYIEAAAAAVTGSRVLPVDERHSFFDRVNGFIDENNIKILGVEESSLSYAQYMEYAEKLDAALAPAQELFSGLRCSKSAEEIELMRAAQRLADCVFDELLGIISTDMTEAELAAEIIYRLRRRGAEGISFEPIVVSGERSSMPHGVPGDRKISKGFLTMDFGCVLNGYCSDMTRTVCIGKPTEKMRGVYGTVLEAQLAGIAAARAGIPGRAVDEAGRAVIERAGYGVYFGHGFGHSLGIEVHEKPNANRTEEMLLPAGAVISAEPGIYLPGEFGVRIEDVIVIREGGCENLMLSSKELIVL